jgi:hypothetical protein
MAELRRLADTVGCCFKLWNPRLRRSTAIHIESSLPAPHADVRARRELRSHPPSATHPARWEFITILLEPLIMAWNLPNSVVEVVSTSEEKAENEIPSISI